MYLLKINFPAAPAGRSREKERAVLYLFYM